jgi:hypothetical protein
MQIFSESQFHLNSNTHRHLSAYHSCRIHAWRTCSANQIDRDGDFTSLALLVEIRKHVQIPCMSVFNECEIGILQFSIASLGAGLLLNAQMVPAPEIIPSSPTDLCHHG